MNKSFKIELSEQELNLVVGALAELPFKLANPIIIKIREQAEKQFPKEKVKEGK